MTERIDDREDYFCSRKKKPVPGPTDSEAIAEAMKSMVCLECPELGGARFYGKTKKQCKAQRDKALEHRKIITGNYQDYSFGRLNNKGDKRAS